MPTGGGKADTPQVEARQPREDIALYLNRDSIINECGRR
jgi:hypothetical protein